MLGCSKSNDTFELWNATRLTTTGSHPVPSPQGDAVLLTLEQEPGDLALFSNGTLTTLNGTGPAARSDFAWSDDGTRFAFSSPGVGGSGATGLYYADFASPTVFHKLWDRGSHPVFLPGHDGIVCACPESGESDEGIWQLNFAGNPPALLAPRGVQPKISPDGLKIAYLISLANPAGRALAVLNRSTNAVDTVAGSVIDYDWLGDSQTLVAEVDAEGSQVIELASIDGVAPARVGNGSLPTGFPQGNEFVYTGWSGDRTVGLFLANPGQVLGRIHMTATQPRAAQANRLVAVDASGIVLLTRP